MSRSRGKLWPTLAALVLFATTVTLGQWQLDRAHEKEAQGRRLSEAAASAAINIGAVPVNAADVDLHRVSVRGTWRPEYGIFLDNQMHQGQVGYRVLMPLQLADGNLGVLIDRGWIAARAYRSQLPTVSTPEDSVELDGIARRPSRRFKELSPVYREDRVWQNVTVERFEQWSGLKLQPMIIRQTDGAEDGLIRTWPKLDAGAERNRGYALQWFAFAALTAILWAYYFFRRSSDAQQ